MHRIFIISDGTGGTAEQILRSALAQFKGAELNIQRRPRIRTPEQVLTVVQEAASAGGFIVHTVVSNELRTAIGVAGRLHDVETIDLMGPLLTQLMVLLVGCTFRAAGAFSRAEQGIFPANRGHGIRISSR